MEMSTELNDALVEVRKAYRLVAIYQRRILDMAKIIQKELEYKPYWYVNTKYDVRNRNVPTDRWSLDMLPLYTGLSMLYLPQQADSNCTKKEEWMLEIRFDNDSGFNKTDGNEPDPRLFAQPIECISQLWLCAFGTRADGEKTNWLNNVFNQTDWPKSGDISCNERTYAIGKHFDIATIGDEVALLKVIEDFKRLVLLKRSEIGL